MSENLNEVINISGGKTNSNVTNDHQENWSGYNAGVSLTKEVKGVDFDLNLMYGNEDGLINQIAGFSLKKNFGAAKAKTAALVKKPKLPKIDKSLTTQTNDTDLREIETLKSLNKELKAENAELKAQNEKLRAQGEDNLQRLQMAEAQRVQSGLFGEAQRMQDVDVKGKTFVYSEKERRETEQLNRVQAQITGQQQAQVAASQNQASCLLYTSPSPRDS